MKSKAFNKLRSTTIAGIAGAGALMGGLAGTARAATLSTPGTQVIVTTSNGHKYGWGLYSESSNGSGLGNVTWAFNPAVTTNWSSGSYFAFSDGFSQTVSGSSLNDYFDAAFQVAVNGLGFSNPDGTVDLTDNVLTTDTVTLDGVDTSIQFAFIDNAMRALYTFTNNTGSSIAVTASIGGNLGSDGSTTPQGSANGDAVIDAADGWYVSNDNTTVPGDPSSDPNFLLCRFSAGATVTPVATSIPGTSDGMGDSDNFVEHFDFDLGAGETKRVMLIAAMSNNTSEAIAWGNANCADDDALAESGLLNGLSRAERDSIVNFEAKLGLSRPGLPPSNPSAGSADGFLGSMGFTMISLAGLLALRNVRVRKRKTD